MRVLTPVLLLLSVATAGVQAGSLEKAYFAATLPGTWAQHESRWEMPDGTAGTNLYTYIRAADSSGRVQIEVDTETVAGPGSGMTTRQLFVMEPRFDLARDFLDRMGFLEASVAQAGDGPASLTQGAMVAMMRQSAGDLTNSVTFKGRTESGGVSCDLYAYSYASGGPYPTLQEGELCLNETVPFGVVFQRGRVTNASGELTSSFEERLLDSGSSRSGSAALLAMASQAEQATTKAATPVPSLSLLEAYQGGRIRLVVEVAEGTGGRRLQVVVVNTTEQPFDLAVHAGVLTIPCDSPLGELRLAVADELRFTVGPGGSSAPISAGQPGQRGATGGRFQLTVYEGQPIFQGSVEVGPLP